MIEAAPDLGVPNLTREKVFTVSKSQLERIRDEAFSRVEKLILKSTNDYEMISSPAVFSIEPWGDYFDGRVEGVTDTILQSLNPNFIIVFIDDLLRVRENLLADKLWKDKGITLERLATARQTAIQLIERYCETHFDCKWLIFAKEHPTQTFVDTVLCEKPRIYISYRITGAEDFEGINRFINKLSPHFTCINPLSIKDWQIVLKYDALLETGANAQTMDIEIDYSSGRQIFSKFPVQEIEEAINQIRTQIVQRDLQLITCTHATVIHHNSTEPSYGVMNELIHSVTNVSHPVYVLYPFKKRLSPFFEQYIQVKKNMISGSNIEELEDKALQMMLEDYETWPTWR